VPNTKASWGHFNIHLHYDDRAATQLSSAVHKSAFTDYGFTYPQAKGAFEVDHLIPLELGGESWRLSNLRHEVA
jgi:hypothetical protein